MELTQRTKLFQALFIACEKMPNTAFGDILVGAVELQIPSDGMMLHDQIEDRLATASDETLEQWVLQFIEWSEKK